jgi:hypothetical protein
MFYIITYSTHSESYFEILKQSCPDIIVIGYGEKWNGFYNKIKSTVNFCKSKNPDDIICVVDGFDSVVLTSKEEILKTYKSFNIPLVFSQDTSSYNILAKYNQDKIFGNCKDKRLNAGLSIGTAKSIIEFWKDIQEKEDDQSYATKQCNKIDYMKLDVEHKLFYNYSSADTIDVKNNLIFINNNKHSSCIISSPGNNNINHILSQLNYTNLPDIKIKYKFRILTYFKYYIKEIILAVLIVSIFIYFKNLFSSVILSLIFFFIFLEYELFVKHIDITNTNKLLYLILDSIHIFLNGFIIYLMINLECNINKLFLLNIIYFINIGFLYFKQFVTSIISNKLIIKPNCVLNDIGHRISYFFDINQSYQHFYHTGDNSSCMKGNMFTLIIIVILNMYCLLKINGNSSNSKTDYTSKQKSIRNYIKKK